MKHGSGGNDIFCVTGDVVDEREGSVGRVMSLWLKSMLGVQGYNGCVV